MAKSQKERDADYRAAQAEHGLIWRGFWIHKSIEAKFRKYVARENKKAIKIGQPTE